MDSKDLTKFVMIIMIAVAALYVLSGIVKTRPVEKESGRYSYLDRYEYERDFSERNDSDARIARRLDQKRVSDRLERSHDWFCMSCEGITNSNHYQLCGFCKGVADAREYELRYPDHLTEGRHRNIDERLKRGN